VTSGGGEGQFVGGQRPRCSLIRIGRDTTPVRWCSYRCRVNVGGD